ncbi:ABC transporter ATP-binding protein [Methylobacterium aquaticum]|uniref:ABC transporter ATP-binding protein n=1 Tax=Methylobacterium aquaticum TaxID=270351 RepID=UPI003D17A273
MLQLEKVTVTYGAVEAVRSLDMTIAAGEVVTLVGANGAGKSSTLKAILGLVDAKGRISFGGANIAQVPTYGRVEAGIALSPEGRHVFPQMDVGENLELGLIPRTQAERKALLERMLSLFPRLRERLRQPAGSLSGGEQQMLAIARALMSKPKLLMLDEPTLGLAPIIVDQIADLVLVLKAEGMSILLSEQNAEMALPVADRAYVMETGAIVKTGSSAAIQSDPAVREAYLGFSSEDDA